jgi:2-methylcitrate dehydratase PrpD
LSLTRQLAEFALSTRTDPGSGPRRAARRTVLNTIGVAAGGAPSDATRLAFHALRDPGLPAEASVIGHRERCDALTAALVNGVSAHVEDFDDTHMATIIHPGASVVSAAVAAAELQGTGGASLVDAVVVGVEIALRVGLAVYPEAFDTGWHMSGVGGPVGAAAAGGRVLGLDETELSAALVIAAAQAAGTQEALGTMTKPLHLGSAASNGLEAALLARAGLTAPSEGLDGPDGMIRVFAPSSARPEAVLEGLGSVWEIEKNSFKPYACGVVSHAAIDAGVKLKRSGCDWRRITHVRARTNPVVLDVMGVREPTEELQAKFSAYHCVAVALSHGGGAPAQFRDAVVRDAEIVALRGRVEIVLDADCAIEESEVTVTLDDGTSRTAHVRHALGTPLAPLSDDDLTEKVRLTAGEHLGTDGADALIDALLGVETVESVGELLSLTVPAASAR